MEQRDGGCRLERVTTDWHYGHQKWKPSGAMWMAEWGVQVCVILSDALMADRPSLIQPITPRDKPFRDMNPVFRREAPTGDADAWKGKEAAAMFSRRGCHEATTTLSWAG